MSQVEQYQCLVAKIGMGRRAVVSVVMREMRVEREENNAREVTTRTSLCISSVTPGFATA